MNNSHEFIKEFCDKHNIIRYTIDSSGVLNVFDGLVTIYDNDITKLPVKFDTVSGIFNLETKNLTTLENCPRTIGDSFICERTSLVTLKGTPEYIKNYYSIRRNKLTTLDYFPKHVGTSIFLSGNKIEHSDQVFEVIHEILNSKNYPYYNEFESLFQAEDMKNKYDIYVRMRTIKNILL